MSTQLLLDTDALGDDLLALIAAAGLSELKLHGVTTFGRRYTARERAGVVVKLFEALAMESVPVAAGADRPLLRQPRPGCSACDEPIMNFLQRGSGDSGGMAELNRKIDDRRGFQFIAEVIAAHPGQIGILCTGPLTNLALAVLTHPEIAELAGGVVIMGGTAWVQGNVSPVAEANILNDPDAAAIVFDRFPRITMVGLDVTFQTLLDAAFIPELLSDGSELGDLVSGIITSCIGAQRERRGLTQMPLHDPLALLAALDPELVKTMPCEVKIETAGVHSLGQTVCRRLTAEEAESGRPVVKVAVAVNHEAAVRRFKAAVLQAVRHSKSPA